MPFIPILSLRLNLFLDFAKFFDFVITAYQVTTVNTRINWELERLEFCANFLWQLIEAVNFVHAHADPVIMDSNNHYHIRAYSNIFSAVLIRGICCVQHETYGIFAKKTLNIFVQSCLFFLPLHRSLFSERIAFDFLSIKRIILDFSSQNIFTFFE